MKKLIPMFAGILSLGLLAAGCGKSATDEALDGMKGFKDKMCACKDADCATKVDEEQDKWEESMQKKVGEKPSKSFIESWEKVKDEYRACRDKAGGE
jgi:hypothetical protein